MAGTRGIARIRGEQLHDRIMRNNHFDEQNKIDERFLNINFRNHREILEDTKIDVYVQKNNVSVLAGSSFIDVTADLITTDVAVDTNTEGIVLDAIVQLRKSDTLDFPFIDEDGDKVYGKIRKDDAEGKFYLDFFSEQGGAETPYTFNTDVTIDYKYVIRTNLSVIPVDAIINGGSGFVADAVDAEAYMNLLQLMKDVYGPSGTLDNDGNANLPKSVVEQIAQEIQDRIDADNAIRDDLASTDAGKGAGLVGVVTDPNYSGITVQEVLSNLAQRIVNLETEDEEEVYEAVGGETEYLFQKGVAKPKTVMVFINGLIQAPGINFEYLTDAQGNITGITFAPDTLKVTNGVPDVLFIRYKKVL